MLIQNLIFKLSRDKKVRILLTIAIAYYQVNLPVRLKLDFQNDFNRFK